MAGHVFVVPGTLQALVCDDVLISTDHGGGVGRTWWPVFGWDRQSGPARSRQLPTVRPPARVARVPDELVPLDGPAAWLVAVGADEATPVSWLVDGVREALHAVTTTRPHNARGVRRIAMPVVGVGRGGFDGRRGDVIGQLLATLDDFVRSNEVDVVLVASNPADYSAVQSVRASRPGSRLAPAHDEKATKIAEMARSGHLALFMGAGTGVPAGLPSWDDLVAELAERAGFTDPEALSDLGSLDSAEVLRRTLEKSEAQKPAEERRQNPLGHAVADVIGEPPRYGLSHVLLAALDVDQAVTTNFDRLYEAAVVGRGGEHPLVVLPDTESDTLVSWNGRRPWLLKLHGDVLSPESVVLDRRSFVRYDASRRPLGGVLQTVLLTKHLLVVGASMKDDNVIRLVHEVAELAGGATPKSFGTILTLEDDGLRRQLWNPEFDHVTFGDDRSDLGRSARKLEIFLDRVALLASPSARHLLDPRYVELLETDEEKVLAASVANVMAEIATLPAGATREWGYVREAMTAFGLPMKVDSHAGTIPVPSVPVAEADLWRFALTYDAYRRHGGFDKVAAIADEARRAYGETGSLPESLEESRASLFFEQRRWRHFGTPPDGETMNYLLAVVRHISHLSGGRVEVEAPTL